MNQVYLVVYGSIYYANSEKMVQNYSEYHVNSNPNLICLTGFSPKDNWPVVKEVQFATEIYFMTSMSSIQGKSQADFLFKKYICSILILNPKNNMLIWL